MTEVDEQTDHIVQETQFEVESEQPNIEPDQLTEKAEEQEHDEDTEDGEPKGPNVFQKFWTKYKAHKKIAIPLTVLAMLIVVFAVPVTRYAVAGFAMKKDVQVVVLDSQTNIPVSGVEINMRGTSAKTDGEGKATLRQVKVGTSQLKATKNYYKDSSQSITVPLTKPRDVLVKFEATGRQVPLHIINKITGQSIADASVKAADTEVQTDQNGEATIVLPPTSDKQNGTVSVQGYNDQKVEITVNQLAVKENTFALTPSGKIYFLSKQTGKIDVVKTDLDGANRQTVLAGTGSEEDTNTVLLASRDWKYLALQSRRDSDKAKLYLISTSDDTVTEIDSGDAIFTPVGWQNHDFVYKVTRQNVPIWQAKNSAVKSFNAETQKLNTLDETTAEGSGDNDYASDSIESVYIQKDKVVYVKRWSASYYSVYRLAGKRMGIYSAKLNGSGKQLLKDFDTGNNGYINAVASEPDEIYYAVYNSLTSFYEYSDGKLAEVRDLTTDSFNKFYPTYLLSPSGQNTFWYEPRDGKNTLFMGTAQGTSPKELATLSEYTPYGWYSDTYVLVSKSNSELYIMPASGTANKASQVLKITDYHKPAISFLGYGGGYGGL